MPKSSKCQKWRGTWIPLITQPGGPQSCVSSLSGLFEKPPEISSQSFPQLIDSNHLAPSSRPVTHHVFLIYILLSNDISNFTASGGNLESFIAWIRNKVVGYPWCQSPSIPPPLSGRDVLCKPRSNPAVFCQQSHGTPILPLAKLCSGLPTLPLQWPCLHGFGVKSCYKFITGNHSLSRLS